MYIYCTGDVYKKHKKVNICSQIAPFLQFSPTKMFLSKNYSFKP